MKPQVAAIRAERVGVADLATPAVPALLTSIAAAFERGDVHRALGDCEQLRALLWTRATTQASPAEYLTVAEAAECLRCSRREVLTLTRMPDGLPRIELSPKHILVRRADMDRFLHTRLVRVLSLPYSRDHDRDRTASHPPQARADAGRPRGPRGRPQ
jgi:hypothetical protein